MSENTVTIGLKEYLKMCKDLEKARTELSEMEQRIGKGLVKEIKSQNWAYYETVSYVAPDEAVQNLLAVNQEWEEKYNEISSRLEKSRDRVAFLELKLLKAESRKTLWQLFLGRITRK